MEQLELIPSGSGASIPFGIQHAIALADKEYGVGRNLPTPERNRQHNQFLAMVMGHLGLTHRDLTNRLNVTNDWYGGPEKQASGAKDTMMGALDWIKHPEIVAPGLFLNRVMLYDSLELLDPWLSVHEQRVRHGWPLRNRDSSIAEGFGEYRFQSRCSVVASHTSDYAPISLWVEDAMFRKGYEAALTLQEARQLAKDLLDRIAFVEHRGPRRVTARIREQQQEMTNGD